MVLIHNFCVIILLVVLMSQPAAAAATKNSYSKSVQKKGITFETVSRPAGGCDVQIVTVTVRRGGKKVAALKSDVDYRAQSIQAADLTGGITPELAVISRMGGSLATEALDVYWLDGTSLSRATMPEPDEKVGYKGGDRFRLEDRLIVRTIPVYRDGDLDGKPTGGTRSLKYEFRDGVFKLYVLTEQPAEPPRNEASREAPLTVSQVPGVKPAAVSSSGRAVTGVSAVDSGIEIKTDGAVAKFRVVRLDKPERIAIDIPGADSTLAGKKLAIHKHGISTVRVGRNKGFLRVVFDTSLPRFPKFETKSSETGVVIQFTQQ